MWGDVKISQSIFPPHNKKRTIASLSIWKSCMSFAMDSTGRTLESIWVEVCKLRILEAHFHNKEIAIKQGERARGGRLAGIPRNDWSWGWGPDSRFPKSQKVTFNFFLFHQFSFSFLITKSPPPFLREPCLSYFYFTCFKCNWLCPSPRAGHEAQAWPVSAQCPDGSNWLRDEQVIHVESARFSDETAGEIVEIRQSPFLKGLSEGEEPTWEWT